MKIVKTIGKGSPKVAIIGCVHGDEINGLKALNKFQKLILSHGSISLIVGNPNALKKRVRYINQDLNRSFPGKKNGNREEEIAYKLKKYLSSYDYVIDIHSTNSNIKELLIVTSLKSSTIGPLKFSSIKNIAYVKKLSKGSDLLSHTPAGVSLEYGPTKNGARYTKAVKHTMEILGGMKMLKKSSKAHTRKNLYTVIGSIKRSGNFKQTDQLKEFSVVSATDAVRHMGNKNIRSCKKIHLLFVGKGRYKGTLGLTASRSVITIK